MKAAPRKLCLNESHQHSFQELTFNLLTPSVPFSRRPAPTLARNAILQDHHYSALGADGSDSTASLSLPLRGAGSRRAEGPSLQRRFGPSFRTTRTWPLLKSLLNHITINMNHGARTKRVQGIRTLPWTTHRLLCPFNGLPPLCHPFPTTI